MATQFVAIVKLDFVPLVNSDEEVPISNIGALKMGLQALSHEDAHDQARAEQKWATARALLAEDSEDEKGPAALGKVQVSDDLDIASIGDCL